MTDRILIFIPCYNCSKQIGRVIATIDSLAIKEVCEVLVIDNGSDDGTREAARDAFLRASTAPWKVVQNKLNYNLGGSHKAAFDYAIKEGFTHIIVLHGDDQANIHDFIPAMQFGLHRKYDSLLGARFMFRSKLRGYSAFRTIGNIGLNILCGLMTRCFIYDQGSGLNMYKVEYLKSRFYINFDDSLIFPNMMFFYGLENRSSFKFLPISWCEEDQASNANAVHQALTVLKFVSSRRNRFSHIASLPRNHTYDFEVKYAGG